MIAPVSNDFAQNGSAVISLAPMTHSHWTAFVLFVGCFDSCAILPVVAVVFVRTVAYSILAAVLDTAFSVLQPLPAFV